MEAVSTNQRPKMVEQLRDLPQDDKTAIGLLSRIVMLEGDVRKVSTVNEFAVLSVNESHKVVPYFQCFLWRRSRFGKLRIQAVSGASQVDNDSPAILSVIRILKFLGTTFDGKGLAPFDATPEKVSFYEEWIELLPPHVLWCEYADPTAPSKLKAGMLFFRETPFNNADITALSPVLDAYRYTWFRLPEVIKESRSLLGWLTRSRLFKYGAIAALIAVMFLPVRESVLAPASVVALDPKIVSSPISGVVQQFHVLPNEDVEEGALLISLDDREIRNEVAVANQELETARAEYLRSAQKSFTDADSKSELELQRARIAQRQLEKEFAETRLEQARIYASRSGVAVFNDENDWIGRPVSVGERIMTLADPEQKEVDVLMPIDDALYLQPGAEVRLFLNTDPTRPLRATLTQTSYEPAEKGDVLAYPLKARIEDDGDFSRIGWRGTAKVYSNTEVSLFYYLFRKPISAIRQFFGF